MRLSKRSSWKLFVAGPVLVLAGATLMFAAPWESQAFSGDQTVASSSTRVLTEAAFEAQVVSQLRRLSLVKLREIETPEYMVTFFSQGFDRGTAVAVRIDLRNTNESAFALIRGNRKTRIATSAQILAALDWQGKAQTARAAEREDERAREVAEFRAAHFRNGRLQVPADGARPEGVPEGGSDVDAADCGDAEDLLVAEASGCSGYFVVWHWWGYELYTWKCDGSQGLLMRTEVNWMMMAAEGLAGLDDLGLGDPSSSGEKTACACVSG